MNDETFDQIAVVVGIALYVSFFIWQRIKPARTYPTLRGWFLFGPGFFVLGHFLVGVSLLFLPEQWLKDHRLFDLSSLGVWGVLVFWPVYTFVHYWYHRLQHGVNFLWRMHQLHHSPPRFDLEATFVTHPLDELGFNIFYAAAFLLIVGLDPRAMTLGLLLSNFSTTIQHSNFCTPRWMSWLITRPEEHNLHHQKGVHRGNYSEWPLWDKLFGTYRKPTGVRQDTGFGLKSWYASLPDLLLCIDVSSPSYRGRGKDEPVTSASEIAKP